MKNTLRNTLVSIAIISAPLATFSAEEAKMKTYDLPTYIVWGDIAELPEPVNFQVPNVSKMMTYDLPTYTIEDIAAPPEPVYFQVPAISKGLVGTTVKLRLTINEEGRPERVRLVKPLFSYRIGPQMDFASQLDDSVRKWKFEPARDLNGNAISVKVILPVQVVKKSGRTKALASLILDTNGKGRS